MTWSRARRRRASPTTSRGSPETFGAAIARGNPYKGTSHPYGKSLYEQNTTPSYYAKLTADIKDDVWAVGIMLYELLYQKLPDDSKETTDNVAAHPLLQLLLGPIRDDRPTPAEAVLLIDAQAFLEHKVPNDKIDNANLALINDMLKIKNYMESLN